jgi:UDP-glucose:(heptosyl)LPS alpha-1,3-glucosyltransferase
MKVALVTMRTDPGRGGAERYTVDLADALHGAGHDVTMLAASLVALPPGVRGVRLDATGLMRVSRYRRFLDALDSHLVHAAYDVVHAMLPVRRCDVYHPHAGLARAMVARDSLITKLFNPRRGRGADIESALLESSSPPVVLCLSRYVKRALTQWYALPDSLLPILFNAVDLARYDPAARPNARTHLRDRLGLTESDVLAAFVGHDFERKGLREAILAMARLRHLDADMGRVRLLIVGRARTAKYLTLAREHGVADNVIDHGHTDDAYSVYRAADLLVLPTRHDPCSLVVLEALAMGVPVISTRFNGACEIMTPGVHGYVLDDPRDVDALALAIRDLLDRGLRFRMSQECLALRPQLAYERHLRTLLDIYARAGRRATPQSDSFVPPWTESPSIESPSS